MECKRRAFNDHSSRQRLCLCQSRDNTGGAARVVGTRFCLHHSQDADARFARKISTELVIVEGQLDKERSSDEVRHRPDQLVRAEIPSNQTHIGHSRASVPPHTQERCEKHISSAWQK